MVSEDEGSGVARGGHREGNYRNKTMSKEKIIK